MSVHFLRELEAVKLRILSFSARVEEALEQAVRAIENRAAELAETVIAGDEELDQEEVRIEEECLKILALYQPVAMDLRLVVAVLKINNDLERLGDLAVNIAERVRDLCREPPLAPPYDFAELCQKSLDMLRRALDSLMRRDAALARAVRLADDEVDAINRRMYEQIARRIRANPAETERLLSYLSASRQLERAADAATNIAEDVIYLCEGRIVRHQHG